MTIPLICAGIDIAKDKHDICVLKGNDKLSWSVATDQDNLSKLATKLRAQKVELVVLEATGGYEFECMRILQQAGLAVAKVNARHVRDFARASGKLAKTDRLDAQVLAEFGLKMSPPPSPQVSEKDIELRSLRRRRQQLVEMRKAERQRLKTPGNEAIAKSIADMDAYLGKQIADLEKRIRKLVKQHEGWSKTANILRSMPGIGDVSVMALLVDLPELGHLNAKEIAALVGVAPLNRDSGTMRGRRTIWGGRGELRRTLYMAAESARRHCKPFKTFFERLRNAGKPHRVAIIAVLRKMLVTLNAMVRDQRDFVAA